MKTKLLCGVALVALAVSLRLFASSGAKEEFVAHEWGTFTSVQGADGIQIEWNPLAPSDVATPRTINPPIRSPTWLCSIPWPRSFTL